MRDAVLGEEEAGPTRSRVDNTVNGGTFHGPHVQAGSVGTVTFQQAAMPLVIPGTPPPRTLPGAPAHFTNRDRELARLVAAVDEGDGAPTVVVLVGAGGVGKTAMALRLGAALRDRYPDGQLHHDLRGGSPGATATPSAVLCRFLHALGVNPQYVPARQEAQADLFRSLVADRRVLVLLDDAHSAAQVIPLVTGTPGSLTVVTSRRQLPRLVAECGARVVHVGPLDERDAVLLLSRVSGDPAVREAPRHAEAVARRCAGLPLALCAAGARMATAVDLDWATLEREMTREWNDPTPAGGDGPQGTDAYEPGTHGPDAVSAAVHVSYAALSPGAARALRLLALRAWPSIGAELAAAACDVDVAEARGLLAELAGARLLETAGTDRYRLHDLVREQAARWAESEERPVAVAASSRATVAWCLRTAVAADACVIPGRWHLGPRYDALRDAEPAHPDAASALAALARERENLTEAVQAAADLGFDDLAWQLCEALWGLFLRMGFHQDWLRTHRLGVEAAVRCADLRAEGRMRCQLAFGYLGMGRLEEAEAEILAAREADRRARHPRGEATAIESLGLLRLRQRRPAEAARCFEEARVPARRVGDHRALALLEHHLGRALRGEGRYAEATAQLERARAMMRELPDPYNEARVLTSLGETLLDAGRPRDAAAPLAEAAEIMTAEGATVQRGDIAALRARCARAAGDTAAEERYLREAAAHHRATGSPALAEVTARLAELVATPPEEGPSPR
ncbi:Tetratricopeptide TPR_4 [Streptantibioticus cattleyicolor NRRL 8057 = DSM 46488]|uniref:Tetratricopeptide TPR_4 n=1 Tax=Streptantibioticus cattleyicolor (strain ATCC 35852 / DSM 46488 / JCM 4925 / NBRC 14057 / NRRL 8057) TaxID=1003195 RepID=G8X2F0_STREN|nr:Tetratricopeptide TPR_4 [Streptantibioticus cattleyicolor NRRL 8057 = DSM 46488]